MAKRKKYCILKSWSPSPEHLDWLQAQVSVLTPSPISDSLNFFNFSLWNLEYLSRAFLKVRQPWCRSSPGNVAAGQDSNSLPKASLGSLVLSCLLRFEFRAHWLPSRSRMGEWGMSRGETRKNSSRKTTPNHMGAFFLTFHIFLISTEPSDWVSERGSQYLINKASLEKAYSGSSTAKSLLN